MKDYTQNFNKSFIVLTVALFTLGSSNLAWAKGAEEKIKGGIDTAADALKKGVEKTGDAVESAKAGIKKGIAKMGEKVEDMQAYFRKKFHETATVGPATVSDVTFNGHHFAAVVKPGERIEGQLKCTLDPAQKKDIKYHSLLIGLKGQDNAQSTVDIGMGIFIDDQSQGTFTLIAPTEPGFYKVRFRPIEGYVEHDVLKKWKDTNGKAPDSTATIGLIYVKS